MASVHQASRPATCPGEETLARWPARPPAGLAYLISRHPPTNLASPALRAGFPGPRNASGRRANPWEPLHPQSEPSARARLPPRALEARPAS